MIGIMTSTGTLTGTDTNKIDRLEVVKYVKEFICYIIVHCFSSFID